MDRPVLAFDSLTVDHTTRTVRPVFETADGFYGLAPGTNGTAATSRRNLQGLAGYTWHRADGSAATGLLYVPTARSEFAPSPWSGH